MTPEVSLPPVDPELPELAVLLGDDAGALLEAAVQEPVAQTRLRQVRYDPGRSVTATYSAVLDGVNDGTTLCAHAGRDLPANAAIVEDGASRVAVWRFPHDPKLPGLPHAVQPDLLKSLLAEVGADYPIELIKTRSYRPRRRAVIEVVTERHRLFVKVVRPSRVAALQAAHTAVAGELRVPRSLGWSHELGIAILEAIPGSTMRRAIEAGDPTLPAPTELTDLLSLLPALPNERPGLIDRLDVHSRFLATILPGEAERLAEMVQAIGEAPREPLVAAHNDLHSAQVIVSEGRINGLIDIDTVGLGRQADDYAMLLGHLFSLALVSGRGEAFAAYGSQLLSAFERDVDRASIRLRTAAAVISFATGPFRAQQPDWPSATAKRLAAAQGWLESAG